MKNHLEYMFGNVMVSNSTMIEEMLENFSW